MGGSDRTALIRMLWGFVLVAVMLILVDFHIVGGECELCVKCCFDVKFGYFLAVSICDWGIRDVSYS